MESKMSIDKEKQQKLIAIRDELYTQIEGLRNELT